MVLSHIHLVFGYFYDFFGNCLSSQLIQCVCVCFVFGVYVCEYVSVVSMVCIVYVYVHGMCGLYVYMCVICACEFVYVYYANALVCTGIYRGHRLTLGYFCSQFFQDPTVSIS